MFSFFAFALAAHRRGPRFYAATVGTDGVTLHYGKRARILPIVRITTCLRTRGKIVFRLDDGTTHTLKVRSQDPALDALAELVRQKQGSLRARSADPLASFPLDRGQRSISEWADALATLESAPPTYRTNGSMPAWLWQALEDPRMSADHRVAAAVALRVAGHADAVERVVRIADGSADPRVRVALREAASGSDERALALVAAES